MEAIYYITQCCGVGAPRCLSSGMCCLRYTGNGTRDASLSWLKRGGVELPGRLGRDQYDLNLCALSASRVLSNFVISRKLIRIDSRRRRPRFPLLVDLSFGIFSRFIQSASGSCIRSYFDFRDENSDFHWIIVDF